MAWQQVSLFNDGQMQAPVWYNPETGEYSQVDPTAASGQVAYSPQFQGESGGGAEYRFTDTGTGAVLADQNTAQTQYTKQLDDKFNSVWNNPNASSWDKALAVQERYGVETLAHLAGRGFFPDIASQLGPHIAARQDEAKATGFTVGGNDLGLWPVILGMGAASLFAGGTSAAAAPSATGAGSAGATQVGMAGASTGAGAGSTAGVAAQGVSGTAGGEFTGGFTGQATGSPGFSGTATGSPGFTSYGLEGTSLAPGSFASESLYPVAGGITSSTGAAGLGTASAGAAPTVTSPSTTSSLLSNPQLIGGLGGAALGALSGSGTQSNTIQTEEGIPDWLMPYVKPTLDKYSTEMQNYQTDPYGIMPDAMKQFQNTINGMYLTPDSNPYLSDYFRLGAERIKGSLSPSFGHMQAFGQHTGYNEALSRGLGDYAVQLYGGAYEKERDRQNQMTAAAPGFLGQSAQAQFQPFSQYLSSIGSLGKSKETPYFTNPWSSILGGAMVGSQFGKAF